MTYAELSQHLPVLLSTAAGFAVIGFLLGRKKKAAPPAAAPAAKNSAPSNSERQRLRDLESNLRNVESSLAARQKELTILQNSSVPTATHAALQVELDAARANLSAQKIQLRKSRDVQTNLQAQANDAGKKVQARAIALENELSAARTEIIRLKAIADPNTDGFKRLEGEIETVRTRLRAVEAQLGERNAELNALKATALTSTARAPRTIAASNAVPGAPLNLLGFEPAPVPISLPQSPEAPLENPVSVLLADESDSVPDNAIAAAGSILGKRIAHNDLTVIEGISPGIGILLAAAGFGTWEALAEAAPEQLHAILVEAGPVHAANSPATWPEQARLAANANWFQLKSLQEKLLSGRPETAYV